MPRASSRDPPKVKYAVLQWQCPWPQLGKRHPPTNPPTPTHTHTHCDRLAFVKCLVNDDALRQLKRRHEGKEHAREVQQNGAFPAETQRGKQAHKEGESMDDDAVVGKAVLRQ